jgi:hypothetical protein
MNRPLITLPVRATNGVGKRLTAIELIDGREGQGLVGVEQDRADTCQSDRATHGDRLTGDVGDDQARALVVGERRQDEGSAFGAGENIVTGDRCRSVAQAGGRRCGGRRNPERPGHRACKRDGADRRIGRLAATTAVEPLPKPLNHNASLAQKSIAARTLV